MLRRISDRNAYSKARRYDTRDYYRYHIKKRKGDKDKVSEKQFREVLLDIFAFLFEEKLMRYVRIKFPHMIGEMEIEDVKCGFEKYKDGTVFKRDLVDWPKTFELWRYDKSARKRRLYVYLDLHSYARVRYWTRWRKSFYNAKFYDLNLREELRDRIFHELTMHEKPKKRQQQ